MQNKRNSNLTLIELIFTGLVLPPETSYISAIKENKLTLKGNTFLKDFKAKFLGVRPALFLLHISLSLSHTHINKPYAFCTSEKKMHLFGRSWIDSHNLLSNSKRKSSELCKCES